MSITQSRLKELLHYNPETGVFTSLVTTGQAIKGKIRVPYKQGNKAPIFSLDSVRFAAAKLCVLYITGEYPENLGYSDKDNSNLIYSNILILLPVPEIPYPLTASYLREVFIYEEESGKLLVKIKRHNKAGEVGTEVGSLAVTGYLEVRIANISYLIHRLIFLYMTDSWPTEYVDHINRDKLDNRWCNLRQATVSQNNANSDRGNHSNTGIKGLHYIHHDTAPYYKASVSSKGTLYTKGLAFTPETEDHVIDVLSTWLIETREELHKEFACHG